MYRPLGLWVSNIVTGRRRVLLRLLPARRYLDGTQIDWPVPRPERRLDADKPHERPAREHAPLATRALHVRWPPARVAATRSTTSGSTPGCASEPGSIHCSSRSRRSPRSAAAAGCVPQRPPTLFGRAPPCARCVRAADERRECTQPAARWLAGSRRVWSGKRRSHQRYSVSSLQTRPRNDRSPRLAGHLDDGRDGTRTRDLRRDRLGPVVRYGSDSRRSWTRQRFVDIRLFVADCYSMRYSVSSGPFCEFGCRPP